MERLNGLDAGMLYAETTAWHMHAGALFVVEQGADDPARALRDLLRARMHLLSPLHRRLAEVPFHLGMPAWIDTPDVDVAAHVQRVGVPAPGGPRELAELAGHLFSTKLDRSRPPWEFWVIQGLEAGRVAFLLKIHHSLIDGVPAARLYEVLFDLEPGAPLARPGNHDAHDEASPSSVVLLADAARFAVGTPGRIVRLAGDLARATRRAATHPALTATSRGDHALPRAPDVAEPRVDAAPHDRVHVGLAHRDPRGEARVRRDRQRRRPRDVLRGLAELPAAPRRSPVPLAGGPDPGRGAPGRRRHRRQLRLADRSDAPHRDRRPRDAAPRDPCIHAEREGRAGRARRRPGDRRARDGPTGPPRGGRGPLPVARARRTPPADLQPHRLERDRALGSRCTSRAVGSTPPTSSGRCSSGAGSTSRSSATGIGSTSASSPVPTSSTSRGRSPTRCRTRSTSCDTPPRRRAPGAPMPS